MTLLRGWLRPSHLRMHAGAIVLGIAGVVVVVMVALLLNRPTPDATPIAPAPTAASAPEPGEIGLDLPKRPKVVVLGDTWSDGYGSATMRSWVQIVSDRRDWKSTVVPDGATTGFLTPGVTGAGTYLERLRKMSRDRSVDLFVVQGGLIDVKDPDADTMELNRMVADVLKVGKRKYPRAEQLVIGPLNPYSPDAGPLESVDSRMGFEAAAAGAAYISPTQGQWFGTTTRSVARYVSSAAAGYPNDKGYKRFATKVIGGLKQLAAVANDSGQ